MEMFLQEATFTAFVALILSFVVAKIVSFAVSNNSSGTDCNSVVCCVDESAVAKEGKGLRVGKAKVEKRVRFVDDVVVRRVDCYQGFENRDVDSVDDVVVGESGKSAEGVDELGLNELNGDSGGKFDEEQCVGVGQTDDAHDGAVEEGCEMLVEGESEGGNLDGGLSAKDKNLVLIEEQKNGVVLESDDMIRDGIVSDQEEEGIVAANKNEGLVAVDKGEEGEAKNERVVIEDEDDGWEGIERSELEKVFAEAVNYVEYGGKGKEKEKDNDRLAKLGSDVQVQLYGLHKVAVEGPCHVPPPMALKVLARAKWNAWQRLGNMGREAAMEQYIRVLLDSIPGWVQDYSADDDIHGSPYLETAGRVSVPEHNRESELGAPPAGDSSNVFHAVPVQNATCDMDEEV